MTECLPEKLSNMLICLITILSILCPLLLKNGFEYLQETFEKQREHNEFQCCHATPLDASVVQKITSKVTWKRKQVAL